MSTGPAVDALPRVDVHTHLAPLFQEPSAAVGTSRGEEVRGLRAGPPGLSDAPALVAWLAGAGLDRAWVSAPPPFYRQGLDRVATRAWVASVNDGLLARTEPHGELDVLAYLPLDQPDCALAELDRLGTDPRVLGWSASAGGGSVPLDDPALSPVWRRVEALDRPLLLHPGTSPDPRLRRHYLANLLGNPVETTVAAAELVFGGVLAAHPGLRLVLVHCGGVVPTVAGRWQRGFDTARPGIGDLPLSPVEALRGFWVDALAHDPAVVDLAVAVIGDDRLVLGSDWPFPMGLEDPRSAIAHLPADLRERVARDNAWSLRGARR